MKDVTIKVASGTNEYQLLDEENVQIMLIFMIWSNTQKPTPQTGTGYQNMNTVYFYDESRDEFYSFRNNGYGITNVNGNKITHSDNASVTANFRVFYKLL